MKFIPFIQNRFHNYYNFEAYPDTNKKKIVINLLAWGVKVFYFAFLS